MQISLMETLMKVSSIYVILHNVRCISVSVCWIDENEMCIADKLSPDR
jgi:hypothetical protein